MNLLKQLIKRKPKMKKYTKAQIDSVMNSAKKFNITSVIDGSEVDTIFNDINPPKNADGSQLVIIGGCDIIDILAGFDRPQN